MVGGMAGGSLISWVILLVVVVIVMFLDLWPIWGKTLIARLTSSCRSASTTIRASCRYWGRRARGRCVICGGKRAAHRVGPWVAPVEHACGWCNKRIQHGMNYGMGQERMKEVLGIH